MKQITSRFIYLLFLMFVPLISSCQKDSNQESTEEEPAEETTEPIAEEPQLVTFDNQIKPIMETYCISCHNEAAAATAGLPPSDFTYFAGARAWGYLMPGFRLFADLSPVDQGIINDWIAGGLSEADYNSFAKAVIDANCISCHDADAEARKDLPKTNLAIPEVAKHYGSQLPSFGILKGLPDEQQQLLVRWIKDGLQ